MLLMLGWVEILYPYTDAQFPAGTWLHVILGMPTVRKYTFEWK